MYQAIFSAISLFSAINHQIKRVRANGIARRGATVFVVQVFGVAVGFACQVLIARLLGKEQYGIHAYVISWSVILLLPAVFGMDTVVLRFFSSYMESKAYAKVQGLLGFARRFSLVMSLLSIVISLIVVNYLYRAEHITTNVAICFIVGLVAIPFNAQLNLNMRLLWACGKPALSAAIVSILRPGFVALLVLMSYVFLPDVTTARVSLAAFALATLVVVGIGAKVIRSYRQERDAIVETPEYEKTVWLKTAIPLLLASSFQVVMTQCSVIMIGYFLGLTEAGYYAAAVRMVGLAGFGLTATNVVVAPMISAAYTSDRRDDLKKALRSGAATIFGLTVPLVVVLLVAGKFGLWLFGESFTVAYPALVVLCVGQIVNALCGCVGYLMSMTGNERTAARILCCAAILNVTLNATLIPVWGMIGAAIATSITLVVWNVWMLVVVCKRLGMNPSILSLLSR